MTKKKFKIISRVFLLLSVCELALLIGFIAFTKVDELTMPGILSVPFLIILIGMLACMAIAFVLDIVESWKSDWFSFLTGYIGSVVFLTVVATVCDYFWGEQQIEILSTALKALVVVSSVRAGEYVLRKEV